MASMRIFRLESEGGPYDLYEEPWIPGNCFECIRYEQSRTSEQDSVHVCPFCKRHWHKYDKENKLWRQVTDPIEWESMVKELPGPEKRFLTE